MNYDLIVKARQVLQPLWGTAWLKGRCWGPKSEKNPYSATNITIAISNELVSVSQRGDKLAIHEFQRTENTNLGKRVRELLKRAGIMAESEIRELISSGKYTWCCTACGRRGEIDPGLLVEVDSRGEGARELILKIDKEHRDASQEKCLNPKIEVLDENLVKQEKITQLLAMERVK